jgi:hypothetical protein
MHLVFDTVICSKNIYSVGTIFPLNPELFYQYWHCKLTIELQFCTTEIIRSYHICYQSFKIL